MTDAPLGLLGDEACRIVLGEGDSDRIVVEALAERRGRDLAAEGVAVVAMGGVTKIRAFLERFGPTGQDRELAGLCDAGEEEGLRRALEATGLGADLTSADAEALGFFVCIDDLEDELIRALGSRTVEEVIEGQGELRALRTLQRQPFHAGRSTVVHLRRFMGTKIGRKARYAWLLVDAVDLDRMPRPLDALLGHL